jgi:hypothetical protein
MTLNISGRLLLKSGLNALSRGKFNANNEGNAGRLNNAGIQ